MLAFSEIICELLKHSFLGTVHKNCRKFPDHSLFITEETTELNFLVFLKLLFSLLKLLCYDIVIMDVLVDNVLRYLTCACKILT